jgi:glutamate racemase
MDKSDKKHAPIGVFDSGLGGISVLKELIHFLPEENYLYFGDSAHAPYGVKTLEEVRSLTIQNIDRLVLQGCKGIVIACNTATSAAVHILRRRYPRIPIVGIEPALKPAVTHCKNAKILVMATPMTLREKKFHDLMDRYRPEAEMIIPLPCPGLMEFVEHGIIEGDDLFFYLQELLAPWLSMQLSCVVLGCTHYPFVKKEIQKILGPQVAIIDGGAGTARQMKKRLTELELLNPDKEKGQVEILNSSANPQLRDLAWQLLQSSN